MLGRAVLPNAWSIKQAKRAWAEVVRRICTNQSRMALTHLHSVAPSSLLGEALHYLDGQWPKLVAVPGQRNLAVGLQPGGERHPALRRRKAPLVVR